MGIIKIYSIIAILLTLLATAADTESTKIEVVICGLLYVPVLVYLLYGG